ncbi:hypothetical protein AVEN_214515-2-1, partial [Araneus ventricosus]
LGHFEACELWYCLAGGELPNRPKQQFLERPMFSARFLMLQGSPLRLFSTPQDVEKICSFCYALHHLRCSGAGAPFRHCFFYEKEIRKKLQKSPYNSMIFVT